MAFLSFSIMKSYQPRALAAGKRKPVNKILPLNPLTKKQKKSKTQTRRLPLVAQETTEDKEEGDRRVKDDRLDQDGDDEDDEEEEEEEEDDEQEVHDARGQHDGSALSDDDTFYASERMEKMEIQMMIVAEQMTKVTSFIDNIDGRSNVVTASAKTVYKFSDSQIVNIGVIVRKHVFKNVKYWVDGVMKIAAGPTILKKISKKLSITDENIQDGIQCNLIKYIKKFLASHRGNVVREIKIAFFGKKKIYEYTQQQKLTVYFFQHRHSPRHGQEVPRQRRPE